MAAKLTEDAIKKALPPETGQRFIFDGHRDAPRGFALRITKAGGKAFVLNYTFEGKQRRKTIGEWPTWSLVAAREEANSLKRRIDSGEDVVETARERRREPTVEDAVKRYCRQHVDGLKSGDAVRRYFERDVVPVIGSRKLKNVRRAEIIELVESKATETPRAGALLLTHIKGLFSWAVDRELIEASPAAGIRAAKVNRAMKPRQRARVLDDEEVKAFWTAADGCGLHRLTAIALKLVLVTGQRPGEVAGMRWSEIDGKVWTIPGARRLKTETEQRVPLTDTAEDLLAQAKAEVKRLAHRRKWEAGDFVFAARPSGGITVHALDRAVARYREALGNKEQADWGYWTPHDLRRTCRTGLSASGVSEEIAERAIGHGHKGIVATYNHHRYDAEKRTALEAWERRLRGIIEGAPADNVVALARGR
jgi:integrase